MHQEFTVTEYWIVNPKTQSILVLTLENGVYQEVGQFQEGDRIISPLFSNLLLTAKQIFQTER
jgi:Uma2 family endonuclease